MGFWGFGDSTGATVVACGRLHNFDLVYNDSEPDQPCYSSPSMPSGFEYLPTRVEDREDVDVEVVFLHR